MGLKELAEDLKQKSDEDLVAFQGAHKSDATYALLAEKEFERRARVHQHELDVELIAKQVRWMKFSTIVSAAAVIVGAIIGALLTVWLQDTPMRYRAEPQTRQAPQQSDASTSVDRIEKVESGPSKTAP